MRKLVTAAATALTLALGAATPALADHNDDYPYQGGGYSDQYNNGPNGNYGGPRDRFRDEDFDRNDGNFDRWERDWRYNNYDQYRYQRPLNYQQLSYRLAQQGYHGVRKVKKSRSGYRGYGYQYGFDYRAFAFNRRGEPVMLRINAYTGRVLDVRYLGRRW